MTNERLDTTVAGGKYLASDGAIYIDAWGKPLKAQSDADNGDGEFDPTSLKLDVLKKIAVDSGADAEAVKKLRSKDEVVALIDDNIDWEATLKAQADAESSAVEE